LIVKKIGERIKTKDPGFLPWGPSPANMSNEEIDAIWHEEAQKRWQPYKAGELKTISDETVMQKYQ
jgi:hypothetical protein